MRGGKIIETSVAAHVFEHLCHEYSVILLNEYVLYVKKWICIQIGL